MNGMIGKEIGPYRIVGQIGMGGMATVYKAYHATMDRYVAVKVMPEQMSQDDNFRRRFEREAKVVARPPPVTSLCSTNPAIPTTMRWIRRLAWGSPSSMATC